MSKKYKNNITFQTEFGGHGYDHIITNVLPKMKMKGFSQNLIDQITIENPARWLTIDE